MSKLKLTLWFGSEGLVIAFLLYMSYRFRHPVFIAPIPCVFLVWQLLFEQWKTNGESGNKDVSGKIRSDETDKT